MVRWSDVVAAEPAFADEVRRAFQRRKHCTIATLRQDGSPRISGIEVEFRDDGDIVLGMMPGSAKARDLLRRPAVAVHGPTEDPRGENGQDWPGEAKFAGRAIPDDGRGVEATWFRVDLTEVVFTGLGDPPDHLLIRWWRPGMGLRTHRRQ